MGHLVMLALTWSAAASAQECDEVSCSSAGTCFVERGEPFCLCDEGFAADELSCSPIDDVADAHRLRRRPGIGERIVEIAVAQERRGPFAIGRSLGEYPYELSRYIAPNDWWCTDFVSWVYRASGVPFTGGYEGGWLVPGNDAAAAWFVRNGLWVAKGSSEWSSFEPRPGDYVRFATMRGGHSAIVVSVEGDTLHTIEGNVEQEARLGRYDRFRDHPTIDGFGRVTLENAAPLVRTSDALEVAFPDSASIAAIVEDDGPHEDLSTAWAVVVGPGEARFEDANAAQTEVVFEAPGLYVLEVSVTDGEHTTTARIDVDVWELPEQEPESAPPADAIAWSCRVGPTPEPDGRWGSLLLIGLAAARWRRRRSKSTPVRASIL